VIEFEKQHFSQKPQIVSSIAQQVMGSASHPLFIGEVVPGSRDQSKQEIVNHNREMMKQKMSELIQKDVNQIRKKMIDNHLYKGSSSFHKKANENYNTLDSRPAISTLCERPGSRLYELAKKKSQDRKQAIDAV